MARRRVNLRFITVIASTLAVTGAGAALVYKYHRPLNPGPYIARGDEAMKQRDFDTAIRNYSAAESVLPLDVSLHLKLGRCYFENRLASSDYFSSSLAEFTKAEELDPDNKEAWTGLLDTNELNLEHWENHPGGMRDREQLPLSINMVREAAQHLVKLEPDNIQAKAAEPILVIRVWVLNLAMPLSAKETTQPIEKQLTQEQRGEQAITDLTALMREHPENEKFPYWIARAKILQAENALHSDHPVDAAPLFAEAASVFDESIAAKPDKVALYIDKAAILTMLRDADPAAAAGVDYRKKIHESLDKAQSLADPKNPSEYQMAKQQWARNLTNSDPARAETVYRDLLTRYPDELGIRLELAKMLRRDASRRVDALALLDAIPTLPPATLTAPQRDNWEIGVALARLQRAEIEIDQLSNTGPGKAYDALVKDINACIDSAEHRFSGTTELLRARGRLQLVNGQVRDAIITLTAAADKMNTENGAVDYELLRLEATAYERGQQNGKAVELLEKAMTDPIIANNPEIHMTLAQLDLQNQDYEKAKTNIDWLAVRFPDNPEVIIMQITQIGPNPNLEQIKPLFDKLPEKTPADINQKYAVARQVNNQPEMLRLLGIINKADPGNIPVVSDYAQQLKHAGRPDDAKAVIAAAQKIHPGDSTLAILENVVDDVSRKEIDDEAVDAINQIKDPFTREMKLSQIYQVRQQPDQEMAHLQKALEIQPDNKDVLQGIFIHYMTSGQFALADAMIPHMAQLDVDDAHGVMLRCKLALAKHDVQNSLQFGRQLTHDFPGFSGSWELYGEALRDSGQLDLACQQFVSALALQATNVDASKNLIQCTVQQGKIDDAKAYIEADCKRFPNDPTYQDMWVQFQILYGNPESVVPSLEQVIKDHPENYRYYGITSDALLASMRSTAAQGNADLAAKYFQMTKDLFQQALTRWPDDLKFAAGLSQLLAESKDVTGAENVLKTISDRPHWKDQPAPLLMLARLYITTGKLDLGEATLHKTIDVAPHSTDAHLLLAECMIREQKYDDALAVLQPQTSDFSVRVKYTDLLLELGRGPQAEFEVSEAMKADPSNNSLINLMLHVYDAEGKRDQGIKAATDTIIANHDDMSAYYWRAKLLASGNAPEVDSAIKDLGFFLDALPTDVDGHILLAQLLDIKRDRDGAIRELETSLKFAPQERRVRMGLISDYLTATPPRVVDGERLLNQTLALPAFAHDPEFEAQAAMVWAHKETKSDQDKAVALIQDAMKNAPNQSTLLPTYFDVLLMTKNYDLLLTESDKYVSDPKCSWFVFCDRGLAKASLSDSSGANAEFDTALDRAGAEPGRSAAESVAKAIARQSGVDKALEKVVPRSQNSTIWKLIAIDLYVAKGDMTSAMKVVDAALPSVDSLDTADKYQLLRQASSLYITVNPPMVDKAMATYQKQLEMNPNDVGAMNDIACVLVDMTVPAKPQEALVWSQRAFDLSLKNGRMDTRVYDTQGWVLILNGRVDDGIDVLHQAIDQADFPEAHYHLARGYLKKQLPEDAERELKAASKLIQDKLDAHSPVDPSLQEKIAQASKEVDEMVRVKTSGKDAASIP